MRENLCALQIRNEIFTTHFFVFQNILLKMGLNVP